MKKIILVATLVCMYVVGWAQKQNVESANNYLREGDYSHAKEYIQMALKDPSTKDKPKTWAMQGDIYMQMNQDTAYLRKNMPTGLSDLPYRQATRSYLKAVELDPSYEKEELNSKLIACAFTGYMMGQAAYKMKAYDTAYQLLQDVVDIHSAQGGKRFASNKKFDTVSTEAERLRAFAAYNANRYDDAADLFMKLKDNPIARDPNVYLALIDIYGYKKKNDAALKAVLDEAQKFYPDEPNIRTQVLNSYITGGNQDELVKKLQEAADKDPGNADLQINLAKAYAGLAFPKDDKGKDLAKPADYSDKVKKAEGAYSAALRSKPDNIDGNFGLAVLYYNEGVYVNKQMNDIPGNDANELKQIEDFKKVRDDFFSKSVPYFEKTYNTLDPKVASLNGDDKDTYVSTLRVLKEVYFRQGKAAKSDEMKKKLEAMK
jgi:hypothetical protein